MATKLCGMATPWRSRSPPKRTLTIASPSVLPVPSSISIAVRREVNGSDGIQTPKSPRTSPAITGPSRSASPSRRMKTIRCIKSSAASPTQRVCPGTSTSAASVSGGEDGTELERAFAHGHRDLPRDDEVRRISTMGARISSRPIPVSPISSSRSAKLARLRRPAESSGACSRAWPDGKPHRLPEIRRTRTKLSAAAAALKDFAQADAIAARIPIPSRAKIRADASPPRSRGKSRRLSKRSPTKTSPSGPSGNAAKALPPGTWPAPTSS